MSIDDFPEIKFVKFELNQIPLDELVNSDAKYPKPLMAVMIGAGLSEKRILAAYELRHMVKPVNTIFVVDDVLPCLALESLEMKFSRLTGDDMVNLRIPELYAESNEVYTKCFIQDQQRKSWLDVRLSRPNKTYNKTYNLSRTRMK